MGERAPNLDQHEEKHDPGKGIQGIRQMDLPANGGGSTEGPIDTGREGDAGTGMGAVQGYGEADLSGYAHAGLGGIHGTAGQVDVPTGGTAGMPAASPSGMGGPGLAGTGTGSDQPQMQAGWDEHGKQHDHLEEVSRHDNAILHGDEDTNASKG